ncbi:hypothetical protein [Natronorubrum sp. DTA7]|uniref:hypothetical protein n=1 Tax=Natronorubrum sp. DTA7 TaxID=3447016 RepID=UPI003F85920D
MLRQVGPLTISGSLLATGSASAREAEQNDVSTATIPDEIELSGSSTTDNVLPITDESELYLRSLDRYGDSASSVSGSNSSAKIVDEDPAESGYVGFSLGAFSESRINQAEYATTVAWVEWETDIDEPTSFEIEPKFHYITAAGSASISPFSEEEETTEWKESEREGKKNNQVLSEDKAEMSLSRVGIPVLAGLISGSDSDTAYLISFVLQKLNETDDSAAIVREVEVTSQTAEYDEHEEDEIRTITETLDTNSQYRLICIAHAESEAMGLAGGGGYVASAGGDGLLPGLWVRRVKISPQGYDGGDPTCPPGEPCPTEEEEGE